MWPGSRVVEGSDWFDGSSILPAVRELFLKTFKRISLDLFWGF